MFWERSGGVGEVRPVWKEGEGGGRSALCRGAVTVGQWRSL